jgi:hypothetical protein
MNEERKKVLEMLAAGKITAEEAEKLLDKLAATASGQSTGGQSAGGEAAPPSCTSGKAKYLRIIVDAPGSKDQVNMRVPLSLVGTGRRLLAIMPQRVSERLSEYGIDAGIFSAVNIENLEEAVRELNVDVEHSDGKKVRIYCE